MCKRQRRGGVQVVVTAAAANILVARFVKGAVGERQDVSSKDFVQEKVTAVVGF